MLFHMKARVSLKYFVNDCSRIKILTLKQMLQILPKSFAQIKENSENSLNKIRQILYSWYHEKEVTKKIQQYNEFNKFMKQNGCNIYEISK